MAKGKTLVVDDEQIIQYLLSQLLTGQGYEVDTVSSSYEALDLVRKRKYDCILSDIKMPEINGMELYKEVRRIDKALSRRMIFITGAIQNDDIQDFIHITGATCIGKPFDIDHIIKIVDSMLADCNSGDPYFQVQQREIEE